EEILTALAKIDGLHVAARRSSFWFKDKATDLGEIASKLNVAHVVEGTVRRDGNRVRVTAELIDASKGFTLWSGRFEREMHGIFCAARRDHSVDCRCAKTKARHFAASCISQHGRV